MNRKSLVVSLGLSLLAASPASADLLPPDQPVAGRIQAEWSALWWQTMLPIPAGQNPQADTTGAFAFLGDVGPVFFLAGSPSTTPFVRSVTVREDQFLFFPVINAVAWAEVSAYGGGLDNLRRDAAETLGITPTGQAPNTTLFARLNGVDLVPPADLLNFRQLSPGLFDVFVPEDNVFGLTGPEYPGTFPAASDGWWLMLRPLPPGNYQLHFGGSTTGIGAYAGQTFSQDITYNLTVQAVPEPSGLLLLGSAGLVLLCHRLRRGPGARWVPRHPCPPPRPSNL